MPIALLTHVTQYTGPGALAALRAAGWRVLCHDASFAAADAVAAFEQAQAGVTVLREHRAAALADAALAAADGALDAVICNDVHPLTRALVEDVDLDDLRATFEDVLLFPFALSQRLLPAMKARRRGAFVFVTSARPLRPEPGYAVPTAIRAGTTAFAQALAKEVAAFEIQVNVVAPNYLYSEMYYPRARYVDDAAGRKLIAAAVPAGRLGTPEEAGELIAFLASGRSRFVTGQVVYFTGGWP
jgi:NAD(P)-dependent dehydrogenase (short-subunit alcohol dehydrogenase family)